MRHSRVLLCVKRTLHSAILLGFVILPSVARADEIVVWNFNDANLIADRGTGTLTTTVNPANITFLAGTTLLARMGDPAGLALAFESGTGLQNNGAILEIRVSTVGFQNIMMSWVYHRSEGGLTNIAFEGSIDGTHFFSLGGEGIGVNIDLGSGISFGSPGDGSLFYNNPNVAIRLIFTGATDPNGTFSIDNIGVEGTPCQDSVCGVHPTMPEPTTMLLLGIGLVAVGMKIRRRKSIIDVSSEKH